MKKDKKKLKNVLSTLAICGTMALASLGLVGCGEEETTTEGFYLDVYNKYVVYAQDNGFETMTYEEWLNTIMGEKGDTGATGPQGEKGEKGDTGATGPQGEKGDTGLGIANVEINNEGYLIITYTDNTSNNLGKVVGKNGTNGVSNYVWIKYADKYPTNNLDIKDNIGAYIGIYNGNNCTAPTNYTAYKWIKLYENKSCAVTLQLDDYSSFNENTTINFNVMYGENLTDLPIPINVFGYEFEGWYTSESGIITANDGKITHSTPITRDMVLMPKFTGFASTHTTPEGLKYNNYTELVEYIGNNTEVTIPAATTKFANDFDKNVIQKLNINLKTLQSFEGWRLLADSFGNLNEINIIGADDCESKNLSIPTDAFNSLSKLEYFYYNSAKIMSIGDRAFSLSGLRKFARNSHENRSIDIVFDDECYIGSNAFYMIETDAITSITIFSSGSNGKFTCDDNDFLSQCKNLNYVEMYAKPDKSLSLPAITNYKWVCGDEEVTEIKALQSGTYELTAC